MTEIEREYADYAEGRECVWGVASINNPLVASTGSLWVMNDISVIHYIATDKYSIEISFAEGFLNPEKYGPKQYIERLLDKLTDWMLASGYDIDYPVSTYDLFATGANINTQYDSIEEMYASFHVLVRNFIDSCIIDQQIA